MTDSVAQEMGEFLTPASWMQEHLVCSESFALSCQVGLGPCKAVEVRLGLEHSCARLDDGPSVAL